MFDIDTFYSFYFVVVWLDVQMFTNNLWGPPETNQQGPEAMVELSSPAVVRLQ